MGDLTITMIGRSDSVGRRGRQSGKGDLTMKHISRQALEQRTVEELEAILDDHDDTYDWETMKTADEVFYERQAKEQEAVDNLLGDGTWHVDMEYEENLEPGKDYPITNDDSTYY